ncbi:RNA polymerase factor sigma-54 [Oceanobacillus sp. J11TS1]|uniref:RNA polymerase factor sigma-54 n=1 Tax=Oceanobacillus sp. J11TS1 TaxID=2807191 RepID=UPI001B1B203E|nr:RNA polymerase factor sigma-54 [Oceanobacillus sp. J11TS1]GIO24665.1 RNA polymerase sigma-54 factor [Oceanobacillus sp. J11TS1]
MQQSLVLKQALSWKMNQSLHQSIEILQLSGIELYDYVQKIAEENPLIEDIRPIDRQVLSKFHDDTNAFENMNAWKKSMYEQLKENMYMLSIQEETIKEAVLFGIDSLNENGYLDITLEDWSAQCQLTMEETEQALFYLQSLEPPGIGARNLQECIRLQLREMDCDFPFLDDLFENNLILIADEDVGALAETYEITEEDAKRLITNMKLCHPNPGKLLEDTETEFIIPEASVFKEDGEWHLSFFHWSSPSIQIREDIMRMDMPKEGKEFLKEKKKELEMLEQAIQYRGKTLEQVLRIIVNKQLPFFEQGIAALQPLTLQDIADALDLHVSTISRAISHKYVQTDSGILQVKYLLQRETRKGEGVARIVVKQYVKEIIDKEDPTQPLSDEKIRRKLEELYQVRVARRTVMKYREELNIPSSSKRKRSTS